ncbi:hypothetical protein C0V70_07750 [Bacteriovorax stolpii]|uniref:Uncharacterized protein n=1 Tax=Bacteriovorax stolpii TaxID=960 RepID=A0A2K9NR65_BACTC|nr:hypothetical protein [Bacteriovorax stolpii]AUN98003.1 hypothetical protein C0V70_07750 [Bacteriovorax stolpii]TDP50309.1 truncated hemoglobin YjbI [Bacteriovorax stolpii]
MRELIYIVVEAFYKKAVYDVLIGYHFEKFRQPEELESHLQRIATFWEMQLTGAITRPLEGPQFRLMMTHFQLGLKRGEIGRWVVLFHQTLDELEQQFKEQAPPEELAEIQLITSEWKKRIAFFKERFEANPQMFN